MMRVEWKTPEDQKEDVRDINEALNSKFNQSQLEKAVHMDDEAEQNKEFLLDVIRHIRQNQGTPYTEYLSELEEKNQAQKAQERKEYRSNIPLYFEAKNEGNEKTPRLYQQYIIEKLLQEEQNMGVELPTGTGKTLIEFNLLRAYHKKNPDKIVVLTAPTGLLCAQHRRELPPDLQELCFDPRKSIAENQAHNKKIIIQTPESLDAHFEKGELQESDISLAIMDEIHIGTKADTGKYKTFPVGEKINQSGGRIIGFTASPGGKSGKETLEKRLNIRHNTWIHWQQPEVWESLQYFYQPKYVITQNVESPPHHNKIVEKFGDVLEKYWHTIVDSGVPYIPRTSLQRIPYISFDSVKKLLQCLDRIQKGLPLPESVQKRSWDTFLQKTGTEYKKIQEVKNALQKYASYYTHYQQVIGESYQGFLDRIQEIQEEVIPHRLRKNFEGQPHPHPTKTPQLILKRLQEILDQKPENREQKDIQHRCQKMAHYLEQIVQTIRTDKTFIDIPETLEKYCKKLEKSQERLIKISQNTPHVQPNPLQKNMQTDLFADHAREQAQFNQKLENEIPQIHQEINQAVQYIERNQKKSEKKKQNWFQFEAFYGDDLKNIYREIKALRQEGLHHPKLEAYVNVLENEINTRDHKVMTNIQNISVVKEAQNYLTEQGFNPISIKGGNGKLNELKHQYAIQEFEQKTKNPLQGTSVLRQGFDTSADTMVHYSLPQNEIEKIQYGGRSGRGTIGRNIYMMMNHPESRDINLMRRIQEEKPNPIQHQTSNIDPLYTEIKKNYNWGASFGTKEKTNFWIEDLNNIHEQEVRFQNKSGSHPDEQEKINVLIFERFKIRPSIETKQTKKGTWYLAGDIQDKTGTIPLRVWGFREKETAENMRQQILQNPQVALAGKINKWNGQVQCSLDLSGRNKSDRIIFLEPETFNPEDYGEVFLEKHSGKQNILQERYQNILDSIESQDIRLFIKNFFEKNPEIWNRFINFGAGKSKHHSYKHGLIEHSTNLANVSTTIAELYPFLNQDIVKAGALLHDIGKTQTYSQSKEGVMNVEAEEIQGEGHLLKGFHMVYNFLKDYSAEPPTQEEISKILNIILGHQGRPEDGMNGEDQIKYGETLAVFLSDFLESKLNMLLQEKHHIQNEVTEEKSLSPNEIWYAFRYNMMEDITNDIEIQTYLKELRQYAEGDIGSLPKKEHHMIMIFNTIAEQYPSIKKDHFYTVLLTRMILKEKDNPYNISESASSINKLQQILEKSENTPYEIKIALNNALKHIGKLPIFSKDLHISNNPAQNSVLPLTLLLTHLDGIVTMFDNLNNDYENKKTNVSAQKVQTKINHILNFKGQGPEGPDGSIPLFS
jgi:3'-5' exoribonuclease